MKTDMLFNMGIGLADFKKGLKAAEQLTAATMEKLGGVVSKTLQVLDVPINMETMSRAFDKLTETAKSGAASIGKGFGVIGAAAKPLQGILARMAGILDPILKRLTLFGKTAMSGISKFGGAVFSYIGKVGHALKDLLFTVSKVVGGLLAVPVMLASALVGVTAHLAKQGKALDSAARETGYTALQVEQLRRTLHAADFSLDDTTSLLTSMRDALMQAQTGLSDGAVWLHRMGLDLGALLAMEPAQQFDAIANAVNNIANPMQRAAAAQSLLGGSGLKATATYRAGLEDAERRFGKITAMQAASAATMARFVNAWNNLKESGAVFFTAMASKLIPLMQPIVDKLADEVLPKLADAGGKFGSAFADAVRVLYNAFKNDMLWDVIKQGFTAAFKAGVSALVAGVLALKPILIAVFQSVAPVFAELLGKAAGAAKGALKTSAIDANIYAALGDVEAAAADRDRLLAKKREGKLTAPGETMLKSAELNLQAAQKSLAEWQNKRAALISESANETGAAIRGYVETLVGAAKPMEKVLADAGAAYHRVMQSNIFGWRDDLEALTDLLSGLTMPLSGEVAAGAGAGAAPGKGSGAKQLPSAPLMMFDELRRIGGGLGDAGLNLQQRIADSTRMVADNTSRMLSLMTGGTIQSGGVRFAVSMGGNS
jgi:hypothetical protein